MESRLGRERAIGIMRKCGAKCCGKGQRSTAERLFREAGTLEAFLKKISTHDVKEGDITYTLEDENTIVAEHHRCFCRQVAHAKEPFDSLTYCHCSAEFNKRFFTAALGREVRVELLQSIVCGADSCRFKNHVSGMNGMPYERFPDKAVVPDEDAVASALGPAKALWRETHAYIQAQYNAASEAVFFTKRCGWSVRVPKRREDAVLPVPRDRRVFGVACAGKGGGGTGRRYKGAIESKRQERF